MKLYTTASLFVAFIVFLNACQAQDTREMNADADLSSNTASTDKATLPVESQSTVNYTEKTAVIYKGMHCSGDAGISKVASQADLNRILKQLDQSKLSPVQLKVAPDFNDQTVLLLSMGQKPTGGYSMEYLDARLDSERQAMLLKVAWNEPKPGMMLMQMLTSPCLLLTIPHGDYHEVIVTDQYNRQRYQLALK